MAAPSTAYTGLSLYMGDCEHGQAKLDTDYTTMKTKFYLDDVIGGKEGVVGCVILSGNNAKLHNLDTRGGKGRIGNMQMLNDGGLNIKSFVEWLSNLEIRANAIRISTNTFVPFYNYAVNLYLTCNVYRGGILISIEENFITFNVDKKGEFVNAVVSIIDSDKFEAFDEVEFTLRTVNEEGTFNEGTTRTFIVKPALVRWNTGTWPSLAVNFPTGYLDLRFEKVPFFLGDTFYLNDILGTTAPSGYYADFEKWYQLDASGVLIDEGYHGTWPVGDPAAPVDYATITHHGYKNTLVNMTGYLTGFIDYDAGTGWDSPVSIYLSTRTDSTAGKYYADTALTSLVSNGYYVRPYGGGDRSTLQSNRYLNFVRIVSGLITETWEYDTIESISSRID